MANRKLGRATDVRVAMLKTQATDLIWHERIIHRSIRNKQKYSSNGRKRRI